MSSEKKIFMTGDINLMGLGDAEIVFDLIKPRLAKAAAVLSNLECCFYEEIGRAHV